MEENVMKIIRDNSLYETDDYEEIQLAFEGYLYGEHRGLDIDEKEFHNDIRNNKDFKVLEQY